LLFQERKLTNNDSIIQVIKDLTAGNKNCELLNLMLKILESKNNGVEEHCLRLQKMAQTLGKELGLSSIELNRLSLLCLLHDIGKLFIPENILTKDDLLNKKEWEIIKGHSEMGFWIANSIDEISHVAKLILYHHEHWDGSGYPEGLKGENIPLLSRITAVVDAYDAMVNKRPYSDPLTQKEAVAELKRFAGSQFDPHLVKIFVKVIKQKG